MPFATTIIQGAGGCFMLSDPKPQVKIGKQDVDERTDTWFADLCPHPLLVEDAPHPHFPGLILDTASYDETAPAFPAEPGRDAIPGDYRVSCHWLGDVHGTSPTKLISRGKMRTVGVGFDQFTEKYISWNAEPMAITGTAADNRIVHPGNTFADGDTIAFPRLVGGSLVGGSTVALPSVYYVLNRTAEGYQVASSPGGSAVSLGTDITAGYVLDARFCPGCRHPKWPNMYVTSAPTSDNYTQWRNVDVTWSGKQFDKPYHRIVTSNGTQMSSSTPIVWDFPGGWTTALYSNVQMPEVGLIDTYLTTDALATDTIPSAEAGVGLPPDPPDVASVFLFGTDETIIHNWPNGWSRLGEAHVDTLNSQISVHIKRRDSRYIWPISLK